MPLTVYLDTSDYSRFADYVAGRGSPETGMVFNRLLEFKNAGSVQFAYSMSVLCELLQYEGGGRELTLRRAAVVERLCGRHTFRHMARLLAIQVARVASTNGLIKPEELGALVALSTADGWFPAVTGIATRPRALRDEIVEAELAKLPQIGRRARRAAKAHIRRLNLSKEFAKSPALVEQLAQEYPISRKVLNEILPKYLDGRLSKMEYERHMFAEIAKPAQFVVLYFERYQDDKSLLGWMRDLGATIQQNVNDLRTTLVGLEIPHGAEDMLREQLKGRTAMLGRRLLEVCAEELREIGVTSEVAQQISERDDLVLSIPYVRFLSQALPEYVLSNAGIRSPGRSPSRSDGGDMAHAIHIPFCDLWRGDRYFASFVKQHTSTGECTIVRLLTDLPAAITQRLQLSA